MAANTPKTMSSRLMTMKFMQRSAAKSEASAPSTPQGPPSKKVRLSNGASAPTTPGTLSDQEILQSALAAEEKKRQEALAKAAEKSGETKWVLSFKDPQDDKRPQAMKVRQAGFAVIDADDDEEDEEEAKPARMQFGGGLKKKQEKSTASGNVEESDDDSGPSSEEYDSDDPTAELIRETKRELAAKERESHSARRKSAVDSPKGPPKPIDEDMDLGGLETLSGFRRQGLSGGGRKPDYSNMECFKCGQKGHIRDNCPRSSAPRGSAGRARGRGRR